MKEPTLLLAVFTLGLWPALRFGERSWRKGNRFVAVLVGGLYPLFIVGIVIAASTGGSKNHSVTTNQKVKTTATHSTTTATHAAPRVRTHSTPVVVSVPAGVARQIGQLAGQDAFLPTHLPTGYHYVAWKNERRSGIPSPGQAWFTVTFGQGGSTIVWGVTVMDKAALPCGGFSGGRESYDGRTAYWTGHTIFSKGHGRNYWTCISSGSGRLLFVSASPSDSSLPRDEGAEIAASATLAPHAAHHGTAPKSASAPRPSHATLSQQRATQLATDGAAWETGLHAYFTAAPHCFSESGSAFTRCLAAAYAKWTAPFAQARRDVASDAATVSGRCKSRLLDYLGSGGAGDALTTTMGFAQKDALARKLNELSQTLQALTVPAFDDTNKALLGAENAC
jgi:hypothetical protein